MKVKVKTNSGVLGIGLLLTLSLGCGTSFVVSDGYYNSKTGEKSSKTQLGTLSNDLKIIEIENQFGNVNLIDCLDSDPSWDWQASCWAATEDVATKFLDEFQIVSSGDDQNQTLKVQLPARSTELTGLESNLSIRVPTGIVVKIVNSFGGVQAVGIQGDMEASNRHGELVVENLDGAAKLSNSHGNTQVHGINDSLTFNGSHGKLSVKRVGGELKVEAAHMAVDVSNVVLAARLKTSHNSIVARRIDGDLDIQNSHGGIDATEISGSVTAANSHGSTSIVTSAKTVSVKAAHGSIKLKISNPDFQSIQAETTHNNIALLIPADVSARLEMKTTHGSLKSEIESDKKSDRRIDLNNQHGNIVVQGLPSADLAEQSETSTSAD